MLNKIFRNILITFFLLSSGMAMAALTPTDTEYDLDTLKENYLDEDSVSYTNVDEVFENLGNRFVLGVFGKSALVAFLGSDLPDTLIIDIKGLSENEVTNYSKPFNSHLRIFVIVVLKATLMIIFIMISLYVMWLYLETLLRTQESGEFLGKSWNRLFSPLKVLLAIALITPIFGSDTKEYFNIPDGNANGGFVQSVMQNDYSLSQYMILRILGMSNEYADKVWTGFVDSQKKYYPAIKMPKVTAKREDFSNLIDFLVCSRSSSEDTMMQLDFVKDDSLFSSPYYISNKRSGDCSLQVKMPFDGKTLDYISKDNFLDKLSVNIDYETMQEAKTIAVFSQVFAGSNAIASNITKMVEAKNNNQQNVNDFSFKKYKVNEKNWRSYCSEIVSGGAIPEFVNDDNINAYKYYASSCLSKDFVLAQSGISNIADLEYPYSGQNYLSNDKVELCVHDAQTGRNSPTPISKDGGEGDIKACITRACAPSGTGSIFECSSVLNMAKTLLENDEITKKGWIVSGAYSYKLFSGYQNAVAQSLINNVDITFTNDSSTEEEVVSAPLFSVNEDFTQYGNITYEEFKDIFLSYQSSSSELVSNNDGAAYNALFGEDGFLGINKFLSCVKAPLKIVDGFHCQNVTEETQDFGLKLMVTGIQLKIINKIFSFQHSIQNHEKSQKIRNFKRTNLNKGSIGSTDSLQMTNYLKFLALAGIAGGNYEHYINAFSHFEESAFSETEMDIFLNRDILAIGAVGALEGMLTSTSPFTSALFTILIVLGVLLGVVLPLFPYLIFLVAFSGWVVLFFESLITILVWSVTIISPSNDHSSEVAKKGFVMILSVFLRAPLIVFGLVSAWLLNNILIGEILSVLSIDSAFTNENGFSIKTIIDLIVVFGVEVFMLYLLYSLIFSMIEGFYEIAQNWLFGNTSSSPFGDKAGKRSGEIAGIKSTLGQVNRKKSR